MYVAIPKQLRKTLLKQKRGTGGFQSLARAFEQHYDGEGLELDPSTVKRVARYAVRYGDGGYQRALMKLLAFYVYEQTNRRQDGKRPAA